jgi:hypothetical protein
MLHGICSPFIETTLIIGFWIAASSSPLAHMKARCGVRVSPRIRAGQKKRACGPVAGDKAMPVAYNPEMRHKASAGPPLQWRLAVLRCLSIAEVLAAFDTAAPL